MLHAPTGETNVEILHQAECQNTSLLEIHSSSLDVWLWHLGQDSVYFVHSPYQKCWGQSCLWL